MASVVRDQVRSELEPTVREAVWSEVADDVTRTLGAELRASGIAEGRRAAEEEARMLVEAERARAAELATTTAALAAARVLEAEEAAEAASCELASASAASRRAHEEAMGAERRAQQRLLEELGEARSVAAAAQALTREANQTAEARAAEERSRQRMAAAEAERDAVRRSLQLAQQAARDEREAWEAKEAVMRVELTNLRDEVRRTRHEHEEAIRLAAERGEAMARRELAVTAVRGAIVGRRSGDGAAGGMGDEDDRGDLGAAPSTA